MSFEKDIEACLKVLKAGGIILYPTDTIWGLGCDASNEEAVAKIYALKKRAENKSMIVLLSKDDELNNYCKTPSPAIRLLMQNETRPLTIIYPGAKNLAKNLTAVDGTVAIRIVKEPFCNKLISLYKKPIVSTSANISGDVSPQTFADISDEILNGVDYTVHYRRDDREKNTASKILLWRTDGDIETIRP